VAGDNAIRLHRIVIKEPISPFDLVHPEACGFEPAAGF
jgi:hypothetical protein